MGYEVETWNMAEQTLKRLSRILDLCVDSCLREEYGIWFKSLQELKKNIAAFLTDPELAELESEFEKLPEGWWIASERRVNPNQKMKVETIFNNIYIYCLRKMKKKGLLMPEAKDAGRAVARMS